MDSVLCGILWVTTSNDGTLVQVSFGRRSLDPKHGSPLPVKFSFSLSVGFGIIMTYASYTKPTDDIALSSVSAASGNGFFEVALGGMIVIPAAFIFLGPESIISAGEKASSLSLGFLALPGSLNTCPLDISWRSILFSTIYCSHYLFTFHASTRHCFFGEVT